MAKTELMQKEDERCVGDRFIWLHNNEHGSNFAFKSAPSPPEPDLIYLDSIGSTLLNLEITGVYCDSDHAEWYWSDDGQTLSFPAPSSKFCDFLQRLISKKCCKSYQTSGPLFLILDNKVSFINEPIIQTCIASGLNISGSPFQEIWLTFQVHEGLPVPSGTHVLDMPLDNSLKPKDCRIRIYPAL